MTSHGIRSHGQLNVQVDGATLEELHGLNLGQLGSDTSTKITCKLEVAFVLCHHKHSVDRVCQS